MLFEKRHFGPFKFFLLYVGVNCWLHIWCLHEKLNVTICAVLCSHSQFFLRHLKASLSTASRRFPPRACAWLSSSEAKSGFIQGVYIKNRKQKVKYSFKSDIAVDHQRQHAFFLSDATVVVWVILLFWPRNKQKPSRKCLLIPKRWTKESDDTLLFTVKTLITCKLRNPSVLALKDARN